MCFREKCTTDWSLWSLRFCLLHIYTNFICFISEMFQPFLLHLLIWFVIFVTSFNLNVNICNKCVFGFITHRVTFSICSKIKIQQPDNAVIWTANLRFLYQVSWFWSINLFKDPLVIPGRKKLLFLDDVKQENHNSAAESYIVDGIHVHIAP